MRRFLLACVGAAVLGLVPGAVASGDSITSTTIPVRTLPTPPPSIDLRHDLATPPAVTSAPTSQPPSVVEGPIALTG